MAATCTDDESPIQSAIRFLNTEFGTDLKQLGKARELYEQISATKKSLEQQVSLCNFNLLVYETSWRVCERLACHPRYPGHEGPGVGLEY